MEQKQAKVVLVVECTPHLDWARVFEGRRLRDGTPLQVYQATWDDLSVVSYADGGCRCIVRPTKRNAEQRSFRPDHILMRSVTRGTWTQDSTNKLFALAHANVPATNSLFSVYNFLEKPIVWSELRKIQQRLGKEDFPLIPQTLYPSYREMIMSPEMPAVAKVGSAHAGKGKILLRSQEMFEDVASLVALQPYFCTVEDFVEWDWDGRVQKIGPHYRVFKRQTTTWKGNSGRGSVLEEIQVTEQWKRWADECAKLFGGIEILGLDFVHRKSDDKLVILELNDTAIGLVHKVEDEDMGYMADIVVGKMNLELQQQTDASEAVNTSNPVDSAALMEQVRSLIRDKIKLQERIVELESQKKK